MKCIAILAQKKTIVGSGLLLIAMEKRFIHCEVGSRDTATEQKLWEAIKDKNMKAVMSDYWQPYEKFVPEERHTQSKAELIQWKATTVCLGIFLHD